MSEKIKEILVDYKSKSNKDLVLALDFLSKEFENTCCHITKIKAINRKESNFEKYSGLFIEN